MLTQTSNKEKKKKKQRTNFHHHGLKTHHHWLIQLNQMRKPKHQTMKKKGKKKNREANFSSPILDSMQKMRNTLLLPTNQIYKQLKCKEYLQISVKKVEKEVGT